MGRASEMSVPQGEPADIQLVQSTVQQLGSPLD